MKRVIIMCIGLLLLTGCSGQTTGWQTGNVALVRTMGVDLADRGIRVSAAVAPQDGGERQVLLADGSSVAEGVQTLRGMGDSFVHLGHTNQLLLGERLVQVGAEAVLDFVARDRQIGPGARLWVLKGGAAEQALQGSSADVADRLERLSDSRRDTQPKLTCTVTRLMSVMARGGSVAVPALRMEGEALQPDGYAVLRKGRLVGFLDREQSRGLELLCGQSAGQMVTVTLPEEKKLVLTGKRISVTGEPAFQQGRLAQMHLRCKVQMDVAQSAPLTPEQRQQAVDEAQSVLRDRILGAVGRAQFWDADFAGIEQLVRASCSEKEWRDADWSAEFRAIAVNTEVWVQVDWPADVMEESNHEG